MSSPKKPNEGPEETKSSTEPTEVDPQDADRALSPEILEVLPVVEEPLSTEDESSGATSTAVVEAALEVKSVKCSVMLVPVKIPGGKEPNKQASSASTTETEESMDTDSEMPEMEEESNLEAGSKSDEVMESLVESKPLVSPDDSSAENSDKTEIHLVVINTGDNPRVRDYHISKRIKYPAIESRFSCYDVYETRHPPTVDSNRSQGDSLSPMDSMEDIKAKLIYRVQADTTDSKSTSESPTSEAASSIPGDDNSMSKQSISDPAVPGHSRMLTEMERAEKLVDFVGALHMSSEGDGQVRESISMWGKRRELDQMETSGALTDSSTPSSLTTTRSEESPLEITNKVIKLSAGRISSEVYSDPSTAATPGTESGPVPTLAEFLGTLDIIGEEGTISPHGQSPSTKGKLPVKRPLATEVVEQDVSPSKRRCRTTADATTSPIPPESPECDAETSPTNLEISERPMLFSLLSPKESLVKSSSNKSLDEEKEDNLSPMEPQIEAPSASTSETEKAIQTESVAEESSVRSVDSANSESGHSMESTTEESGMFMESVTEESILSIDSGTEKTAPYVRYPGTERYANSEFEIEELETDEPGPSVKLVTKETGQPVEQVEKTEKSVELRDGETGQFVTSQQNEEPSAMEQDSDEKPDETGETNEETTRPQTDK